MIKYITSRPLWFNILVAIGIVVIFFLIFMFSLDLITRHGHSKTVPSVTMKNINDAQKQLTDAGFETVIQDSVYYDSLPPGVVIKQIPEADQVIKANRAVYVVINRFVAPDVTMPNIIGYSFRNAEMTLNNIGIKFDTVQELNWAKSTVIRMNLNNNPLKPGDKIKVGSRIELVIASGVGADAITVPNLLGYRFFEAKMLLDQYGLEINPIANGIADIENAFIYKQTPSSLAPNGSPMRIRQGQMVDVFLQVQPYIDSTKMNSQETPQMQQ